MNPLSYVTSLFLIYMVICIIVYLGGQIKKKKFRQSDVIYVMIMLILTIMGYFVVKFVKHPVVLGITFLITFGVMLGANIFIYNFS